MEPSRIATSSRLPDYETALRLVLESLTPLGRVEHVALAHSAGRILAADVRADRPYPPFNRSAMDGYALRAADLGRFDSFRVVGMAAAGSPAMLAIGPGETARIATGAPLPPDADAVIPHEQSDRGDPVRFSIKAIEPWSSVHRRGADAAAGAVVVAASTRLAAHHLGILATVGCARVPVMVRPRLALLTSGDEVRPHDALHLAAHQIRNSNSPMLATLAETMGAAVDRLHHLPDRPDDTVEALRQAIAEHDVVVTVGGISAGERDCFHDALAACHVETVLKGAAIQPGKPIFVGRAVRHSEAAVVVGLPGNPVSSLATAHLFLWPILRVLGGASAELPWTLAYLKAAAQPNAHRQAFRPSKWDRDSGRVEILNWAGSGDLIHTAASHGLAALPLQDHPVAEGTALRFLPWCWGH